MRYLFLIGFFIIILLPAQGQNKHTNPPNIILIIGDDISADDIGAYVNKKIRTPHIDALAKNGLRFNNMFVPISSCSPSRVSMLTGRYPHNTGAAELHTVVPAHLSYFPELLKENGYYTALAGKWHEGPNTTRAYDTILADPVANGEGGEAQWLQLYHQRPKEKPFFFWLASYDAHRPWSAGTTFKEPYKPEDVEVPSALIDDLATRTDIASYYNEITRLDSAVGVLTDALENDGQLSNTVILFIGDNARPFPAYKTRVNDRGLKTPFIIQWPDKIKKQAEISAMVSSIDIAPTLLEMAGVPSAPSIQGASFEQLLNNYTLPFRNYIFGEHNWHDYEAYERSVRTRNFLYIYNGRPAFDNGGPIDANQSESAKSLKAHRDKHRLTTLQKDVFIQPRAKEEFYDLRNDSEQLINQMSNPKYKADINRMKTVLQRWQKETGDTEPNHLTKDWYDREDGKPLPEKEKRSEMPGSASGADKNNNKGPF